MSSERDWLKGGCTMKGAILLLLLSVSYSSAFLFRTKQRVIVRGRLFCGEEPAANVLLKLVDEDTGPDPDDEMKRGRTDAEGNFQLDGVEYEMSNIDPWLKIYHDCNDYGLPCQRKWKWKIPDKYINQGDDRSKVFDIGEWNLEVMPDEEERDCIH